MGLKKQTLAKLNGNIFVGGGIYFVANLFNKAIAFITIPIFTRMLTTSEYGIVSTYIACVGIMGYFMGLSSEYTVRNAFIDHKKNIPRYMSSMYLMTLFVSIFIAIVVTLVNTKWRFMTSQIICICCLIQAFMTYILNATAYRYMMEKEFIRRSILLAMPNLISVILGIFFIYLLKDNKEMGRIVGYVISYSLFGMLCLFQAWRKHKPEVSIELWRYILNISLPLVLQGVSMLVLSQSDRIMITSLRSESETGIYSAIYSLSMMATAVTGALEGIWTPWFTERYKKKDYKGISKRAGEYLRITAIISVMAMLVAPEVLKIMAPKEYWSGIALIPPLVISVYIMQMYSSLVGLEVHEKKTKSMSVMSVLSMMFNVILNYIFIPQYGALAAAYTTLASYFLLFILHWFNVKKINGSVFIWKDYFIPSAVIVFFTIGYYFVINCVLLRWIGAFLIGIIGIIILYKKRLFLMEV